MPRPRPCPDPAASPVPDGHSIAQHTARSPGDQAPSGHLLTALVEKAVEVIEGAEFASLSLITQRETIESLAPSGALPLLLDWMQVHLQEGPSLDVIHEQSIVRIPDFRAEARWPAFTLQAARAGVRSMLIFELFAEDDTLGSLNLYASHANAFTAASERAGLDIVVRARTGFSERTTQNQLREALLSRDTIGQAKGILMERFKVTDEEAFKLLTRSSSLSNRKLRDIANELTRTGTVAGQQKL